MHREVVADRSEHPLAQRVGMVGADHHQFRVAGLGEGLVKRAGPLGSVVIVGGSSLARAMVPSSATALAIPPSMASTIFSVVTGGRSEWDATAPGWRMLYLNDPETRRPGQELKPRV